MINDNIRRLRTAKGLSQEEMAIRLNVVRQTVSKWENGLSVPDAEVVIRMAELFDVPVSNLLGIEAEQVDVNNLAEELARLNEQLAQKVRHEGIVRRANQKRGLILLLSFVALVIALSVKNQILSLALFCVCIFASIVILYRNLALLTGITTKDMKLPILRVTTIVNVVVFVIGIAISVLIAAGTIQVSERGEEIFATLIISCAMIFAGIISPKLPFTRHTGLRLPWTIQDEDTWNVAHRIVGYISLPLALLYIACSLTTPYFDAITIAAVILWIGLPGGISLVYFWKKTHGKL